MSLNVLIVDDSAVMRAMIIKTLQVCGLQLGEVHQAGNGREGLDALNDHWVDLVFADINMPEMNGEEMIDRMRANPDTADVPDSGPTVASRTTMIVGGELVTCAREAP